MNQESPQINNSRKRDKRAMIPAITVKDPFNDFSRYNDVGFSLVSPDMGHLQSAMNKSSPEFNNNIFFGSDTGNMISSPYKDDNMSESNFRLVSPTNNPKSPFSNNFKVFTGYKNLISNESSVSNLFGSPSPRQMMQPINFNYDESLFNMAEKGNLNSIVQKTPTGKPPIDFSLNLYKIPNSNLNANLKIDELKPMAEKSPTLSAEKFSLSVQTELKFLSKLFSTLVKVFTKKEITEADLSIGTNELKVLNYVLHRKYLKRLTSKDIESSISIQLSKINGIVNSKSHKRPEECYKFIFTRVLKFLKKSFKKNFNIKQNLDEQFYGYYFAELAQKNQEPLENYYYPLTKKDNKKETLNSNYFAKIFQSKNFINDLVKYINEHLYEEYKTEIIQKLESLLLKWDPYFAEEEQKTEKYIEEIKQYLMKNKRCKLPWTLDEVKEAVLRVYSLIDTHSNSNLSVTFDKSSLFQ